MRSKGCMMNVQCTGNQSRDARTSVYQWGHSKCIPCIMSWFRMDSLFSSTLSTGLSSIDRPRKEYTAIIHFGFPIPRLQRAHWPQRRFFCYYGSDIASYTLDRRLKWRQNKDNYRMRPLWEKCTICKISQLCTVNKQRCITVNFVHFSNRHGLKRLAAHYAMGAMRWHPRVECDTGSCNWRRSIFQYTWA
jgi:hypothetical protein